MMHHWPDSQVLQACVRLLSVQHAASVVDSTWNSCCNMRWYHVTAAVIYAGYLTHDFYLLFYRMPCTLCSSSLEFWWVIASGRGISGTSTWKWNRAGCCFVLWPWLCAMQCMPLPTTRKPKSYKTKLLYIAWLAANLNILFIQIMYCICKANSPADSLCRGQISWDWSLCPAWLPR